MATAWRLILLFLLTAASVLPAASMQATRPSVEHDELEHMIQLLEVTSDTVVADVGAGWGEWTVGLARRANRVLATEVVEERVDGIRRYARKYALENVTVILASREEMRLPDSCCDALLLRLVYHAFRDPEPMLKGLRSAVKRGGRVLIIDFRPQPDELTRQMAGAGFDRVQLIHPWHGRNDVYAILFRRALR